MTLHKKENQTNAIYKTFVVLALECWTIHDKQPVLLFLDPFNESINGSDDGRLADQRPEHRVHLERLRHLQAQKLRLHFNCC